MQTDYERYLRTDELLALQKSPAAQVNPDELLFQVTHQSAELWMKAVIQDLSRVVALLEEKSGGLRRPTHLLRRCARIIGLLGTQVLVLEMMNPADYHQIRTALGRGSGQDSPGFNRILAMAHPLADACSGVFRDRGVRPVQVLGYPDHHAELHDLLQAMLEFDEQFSRFRETHLHLVRRQIGLDTLSLKGVPAQKLRAGVQAMMFPELWEAISTLTNTYGTVYGDRGGGEAPGDQEQN